MRAAYLAFCNDIEFANWDTYQEVHRIFDEEFGIELEDSFWLFDPNISDMALFGRNVNERGPRHDELLQEIKSGRLSILHSAGFFSRANTLFTPNRKIIAEGLEYLKNYAIVPKIWTNHGDEGDIQNIGGKSPTYQQGDLPSSDCYILDLLLHYGIEYFCTDINLINQFVLSMIPKEDHSLLEKVRTRSGHEIITFNRYRGALKKAPDAQSLGQQLSDENLSRLVENGGCTIIYQHLCVHRDEKGKPFTAVRPVFPEESVQGLMRIVNLREQGVLQIVKLSNLLKMAGEQLSGDDYKDKEK